MRMTLLGGSSLLLAAALLLATASALAEPAAPTDPALGQPVPVDPKEKLLAKRQAFRQEARRLEEELAGLEVALAAAEGRPPPETALPGGASAEPIRRPWRIRRAVNTLALLNFLVFLTWIVARQKRQEKPA